MRAGRHGPALPEHLIRTIWQQQLFRSEQLCTSDGRPVTVLSAGTANADEGPDFLGATIRIGGTVFHGDVEIHRAASGWKEHGHATDPHYNRVILHVVLTSDPSPEPAITASRRALPALVLHPYLDPSLDAYLMKMMSADSGPHRRTFPCASAAAAGSREILTVMLSRLARERLELKIRRFESRLHDLIDERRAVVRERYPRYYGDPRDIPDAEWTCSRKEISAKAVWEQLLYEGIMEGMGYSKNRAPFLALARSMRLALLREHDLGDQRTMEALLFGAAGLLPSLRTLQDRDSRRHVQGVKRRWKELRPPLKIRLLHEGDWLFFRLRPHNFPTARLAAMSYLLPRLFAEDSFRELIGIFRSAASALEESHAALLDRFRVEPAGFWHSHQEFRGKGGGQGVALGASRVSELLVNVAVPVVLLYSRIFHDQAVRTGAFKLYGAVPATAENSVSRVISEELLQGRVPLTTAMLQQGAIQLYAFYCLQQRCCECAMGKSV